MARRARVSQKDRLARLRAEKEVAGKKADKKAGGGTKTTRTRAKKKSAKAGGGRKVMMWGVFDWAYRRVEAFPYKQKAKAEALCAKLTREKKKTHIVKPVKLDAKAAATSSE